MTSYQQDNIKLKEAMVMELEQGIRVWEVSGFQITNKFTERDIPKNATKPKTSVMKYPNGAIGVFAEWTSPKGTSPDVGIGISFDEGSVVYMKPVVGFSSLEEMQDKYPHLFELEGYLYTLR